MKKKNILNIKNMVCPRCIKVVQDEFEKLGIKINSIIWVKLKLNYQKKNFQLNKISKVLKDNGFELIDDSTTRTIEKIKKIIISVIQEYEDENLTKINFPSHNIL